MIKSIKQRMDKDEEDGFTLIELLVVVLIIGILMAIAIPTFLSLTGNAKTNAAESDLTTATQDEATLYTTNGTYDTSATLNIKDTAVTPPTGVQLIDPGLNWFSTAPTWSGATAAGTKSVFVNWQSTNEVILGTAGQNGSVYWVDDKQGALTYALTKSTVVTAPIAADFTGNTSWASLASATPAST